MRTKAPRMPSKPPWWNSRRSCNDHCLIYDGLMIHGWLLDNCFFLVFLFCLFLHLFFPVMIWPFWELKKHKGCLDTMHCNLVLYFRCSQACFVFLNAQSIVLSCQRKNMSLITQNTARILLTLQVLCSTFSENIEHRTCNVSNMLAVFWESIDFPIVFTCISILR